MEHSEKVRQLEEAKRQRQSAGSVIYPIANQQGCAMAPFAFAQAAGPWGFKGHVEIDGAVCIKTTDLPLVSAN